MCRFFFSRALLIWCWRPIGICISALTASLCLFASRWAAEWTSSANRDTYSRDPLQGCACWISPGLALSLPASVSPSFMYFSRSFSLVFLVSVYPHYCLLGSLLYTCSQTHNFHPRASPAEADSRHFAPSCCNLWPPSRLLLVPQSTYHHSESEVLTLIAVILFELPELSTNTKLGLCGLSRSLCQDKSFLKMDFRKSSSSFNHFFAKLFWSKVLSQTGLFESTWEISLIFMF